MSDLPTTRIETLSVMGQSEPQKAFKLGDYVMLLTGGDVYKVVMKPYWIKRSEDVLEKMKIKLPSYNDYRGRYHEGDVKEVDTKYYQLVDTN